MVHPPHEIVLERGLSPHDLASSSAQGQYNGVEFS